MFTEIKFQRKSEELINGVSAILQTATPDTWRNNPKNRFIVLNLNPLVLELILESYGEPLAISHNPIDIFDESLDQEELEWMKNLLDILENIASVLKEFDEK